MAQPPSQRASAQPTLAPSPGAASVRVANVTVRMGGEQKTTKKDDDKNENHSTGPGAQAQRQKRREAADADAFSSEMILITSEDLRPFTAANGSEDEDDDSGHVQIPAIDFS